MPVTLTSPQGHTISAILTAAKLALVNGTALDESKVFITLSPNPIKDCFEQHLTLRLGNFQPDSFGGAGRRSTRVKRGLIVTAFTRTYADQIRRDDAWLTDTSVGHYLLEDNTINALHDEFLFDPDGNKLTALPLHWSPGVAPPNKPDADQSWGWSIMVFELDYVQLMTLNSTFGE